QGPGARRGAADQTSGTGRGTPAGDGRAADADRAAHGHPLDREPPRRDRRPAYRDREPAGRDAGTDSPGAETTVRRSQETTRCPAEASPRGAAQALGRRRGAARRGGVARPPPPPASGEYHAGRPRSEWV